MNGLARLAVCCLFLVVCTPFALADTVAVTGYVNFTPTSLSFEPPFATQTDTGIFGGFTNGTVDYLLGTVPYTGAFSQTEEAFTITSATGDVLAFYAEVNTPTQSLDNSGNLAVTLDETGFYTINGGSQMAGFFNLNFDGTSPTGSTSDVEFFGDGGLDVSTLTGVTPEPGSFLLMGTGFLALAGLLRTRRRPVAAISKS